MFFPQEQLLGVQVPWTQVQAAFGRAGLKNASTFPDRTVR